MYFSLKCILLLGSIFASSTGNTEKKTKLKRSIKVTASTAFNIVKFSENMTTVIGGDAFTIFSFFVNQHKLRWELIQPVEETTGQFSKNKSWSGIIGRIVRKDADVALPTAFITYPRYQVVGFSVPFFFAHMKFVIHAPKQKPSWTEAIKPFTPHMWACVVTAAVLEIFVLYYLYKMESPLWDKTKPWSMRSVCWFVYGSLVNQGTELSGLVMTASRILIAIWSLASFVIVASYGGNLVSFLTHPSSTVVPTTFHELAKAVTNGEYVSCTLKNTGTHDFFKNAKKGTAKILGESMKKNPRFTLSDTNEIISLVLTNKVAFIGPDFAYGPVVKAVGRKKFFISKDSFLTYMGGFIISKDFYYRKEFNSVLRSLYETGTVCHIEKYRSLCDHREEIVTEDKETYALTLEMLLSPFLVLVIGYSLSTICFIIELIIG